jgi:DNA-binding GntR family transcriptional regulator
MHMLKATGSLGIELAIENLSRSRNASQMAMLSSQLETTLEIGRNRESYRWFNALVQWHYLVNEVSENGYLNGLWDDFSLPLFNRGLSQVLPGAHWDQYVQNYENIGQAFWAMKGDECSRLFVDHINWAVHLIRQRIPLDQAV